MRLSHVSPTPGDYRREGDGSMARQILDAKTLNAIGRDAGNKSMRAAGRTVWNEDDRDAAHDAVAKLVGAE